MSQNTKKQQSTLQEQLKALITQLKSIDENGRNVNNGH